MDLNKVSSDYNQLVKDFDQVLFVFPLYVDGMPGQVKHFYETLYPFKDILKGKQITFIIHSGFSDGIQSKTLEKHCNRFAKIMNMNNHGVIIIPGSEGFRLMPPSMTKKKHLAVSRFGASYKDKKGDTVTISNSTMTDEKALKFLKTRPKRIELFSDFPSNWKQLIKGKIETEVEKKARLAIEAEAAVVVAAKEADEKAVVKEAEEVRVAENAAAAASGNVVKPTLESLKDLSLKDLRLKYPNVRATSTKDFVEKVLAL